jgi:hypothetical protein
MNRWGPDTFGDPCRACGFSWSQPQDAGHAVVMGAPAAIGALVAGRDGGSRAPGLDWTVAGYVCHVGDSIRVWAERLANVALGDGEMVGEYDQDLLARARHYENVGVQGAVWSLRRAVLDWSAAVELASTDHFTMAHPELGEMSLHDVVLIRAHDVTHHTRDIERSLAG